MKKKSLGLLFWASWTVGFSVVMYLISHGFRTAVNKGIKIIRLLVS